MKKYPHLQRFGPFATVLVPIVLLSWLLWYALLGAGSSTVFASRVSSTRLSTAVSLCSFYSPLATDHSPLIFLYFLDFIMSAYFLLSIRHTNSQS